MASNFQGFFLIIVNVLLVLEQVGVDLNLRIPECDYFYTHMHGI